MVRLDDGDAPDLLALGTGCAAQACDVACDYIPFVCTGCKLSFCADHRSFAAHSCGSAAAASATTGRIVVPCPVCARGVELPAGMSAKDEAGVSGVVDAHMRSAVSV